MVRIEYSYPSASGKRVYKIMVADDFKEAEEICRSIEALTDKAYKIEDVSNYII